MNQTTNTTTGIDPDKQRADPVDQIRDMIDEGGPDILSRIAELLLSPQEIARRPTSGSQVSPFAVMARRRMLSQEEVDALDCNPWASGSDGTAAAGSKQQSAPVSAPTGDEQHSEKAPAANAAGLAVLAIPTAIMNLPCKTGYVDAVVKMAYQEGHRDARHSAADLVLARADELAALADRAAATSTAALPELAALLEGIDNVHESLERYGGICEFEGHPMIYASTLEHMIELRGQYHVAKLEADRATAKDTAGLSTNPVAIITGSDVVIGRESRGLQWAKGVKPFDFEPGTRLYVMDGVAADSVSP